ncbi:MAG: hypothetical protein HOP11_15405 [Saprospiraceae bacterium]|nr:hypothetical protein [Saprospiraceae bacterium]
MENPEYEEYVKPVREIHLYVIKLRNGNYDANKVINLVCTNDTQFEFFRKYLSRFNRINNNFRIEEGLYNNFSINYNNRFSKNVIKVIGIVAHSSGNSFDVEFKWTNEKKIELKDKVKSMTYDEYLLDKDSNKLNYLCLLGCDTRDASKLGSSFDEVIYTANVVDLRTSLLFYIGYMNSVLFDLGNPYELACFMCSLYRKADPSKLYLKSSYN